MTHPLTAPTATAADLLALYRHLHAHPEPSQQETRTAALLAGILRDLGYAVHERIGGTGVVGILRNGAGPTVVLRADMDALPVREDTGLDYASAAVDAAGTPLMHACGHDIHMTCAIGAARDLAAASRSWSGTLVILLQPAEEIAAGAAAMIADGVFDLFPKPSVLLGQHVGNLPAGVVSFTPGPAMAAAESLRIRLTGRGAHGSRPQASIDPVLLAAHIVVRLQSIVAREISPSDTAVVTVGALHAGAQANVIPDTAEIAVNLRSLTPEVHGRLRRAVVRIVEAECAASGTPVAPEITTTGEFPVLSNDPAATALTVAALRTGLGEDRVREVPAITISEDFGLLGQAVGAPSFFWFLGSTHPGRFECARAADEVDAQIPANHSSRFAPEPDTTIPAGIAALTLAARAWLDAPPETGAPLG